MEKFDLSILMPSRNEMFLAKTVEDILSNIEGNTEIIVVLDGAWADPGVPDDPRVTVIYHPESIGQRAAQNEAARLSSAKYVMKLDAHCSMDKGFDVKMMDAMEDDITMVPIMKNLHAFDWICGKCGHREFQGPDLTNCPNKECDNTSDFKRDIVWKPNPKRPSNTAYRFTKQLQFKYFPELKKRQTGDLVESMSLQGSCFMATREKYWELELCDESWGSWGQQGSEVALKTWLSGGRVICNKKTWYAHLFRTRKGFNWPYPAPGKSQMGARKICRDIFLNDKWPKAIHTLDWLIEKFAPVPDWHDGDYKAKKQEVEKVDRLPLETKLKKVVYYTDNRLKDHINQACQTQLKKAMPEKNIVSVSLEPIELGTNTHLPLTRGYLTMAKQILVGLLVSAADIIFFCEHDVLYHPTHFDFVPPKKDVYYYNTNVWKLRSEDGHAMRTDDMKQLSGMCAYRELLVDHYLERVRRIEKEGFTRKMGFEPGTHNRGERVDDFKAERWESEKPNIDIRHNKNLTPNRWKKKQFRNQKYTKGWQEIEPGGEIEGWGKTSDLLLSK